jgi:hypothetical protein
MYATAARYERPMRMAKYFSFISAVLMGDMLRVTLMGGITVATSASLMA